jgi:hypothetical protein
MAAGETAFWVAIRSPSEQVFDLMNRILNLHMIGDENRSRIPASARNG